MGVLKEANHGQSLAALSFCCTTKVFRLRWHFGRNKNVGTSAASRNVLRMGPSPSFHSYFLRPEHSTTTSRPGIEGRLHP